MSVCITTQRDCGTIARSEKSLFRPFQKFSELLVQKNCRYGFWIKNRLKMSLQNVTKNIFPRLFLIFYKRYRYLYQLIHTKIFFFSYFLENDGIFFGLAAGKTRRVRARDESDEQENEPCQAVPPLNRAEAVRYNQELGRYGPATPGQYERPSVLCNHCCPRQYNVRQATQ